jgi:hypothetical protein
MSNDDASAILGDIADKFLTAEDGKELVKQIQTNPEALLQDVLATYDSVNQQWANYGENRAGIIQAQKVAADAQSSIAQLETDVTASFASANNAISANEAAIQQKMTAYADASGGSAIYTLKTGITYGGINYDAGLSVAVTINGTQVDTRVAINANQFIIMSGPGGSRYSPFAVVNGQVFIDQGFIGDGTITNAKIGNYIQSNNYDGVTQGWQLNKSGTFINLGNAGGAGAMKSTNTTISARDDNGVLRVQVGLITGVF